LSHATEQYWTIASLIYKMEELSYPVNRSSMSSIISDHFYIGRKKTYIHNKIMDYMQSINPYKDDWENDIDANWSKWMDHKIDPFTCTTCTDFKSQFIIQAFINECMKVIHTNLVKIVQNTNKWFQQPLFKEYQEVTGNYHPLVILISECCNHLKELEYSNSSDPIEETENYYKIKIDLKDFLLIPTNIDSVFSRSNHQAKLKARAVINNKLINSLTELQGAIRRELSQPCETE
jgi:hypothetical protein